jgi:hypothetical protein
MAEIVTLHQAGAQDDIVGGLRRLADILEEHGTVGEMDLVTTVVVSLGHTRQTPQSDGSIEHKSQFEMFAWWPRKDIFTIRGLLSTICNRF